MSNKKKVCIAIGIAIIVTFLLWLVIDVIFNGTIREYTYNLLYEKFSYGWENFRLFLYASFLLFIFVFIVVYFVIPSFVYKKFQKKEQNKIKKYISEFLSSSKIPEIDDEYKELKDILLQLKIKLLEEENKKNEMISNIAHDLRTPLTSISGYLMLLNDEEDLSPNIRISAFSAARSSTASWRAIRAPTPRNTARNSASRTSSSTAANHFSSS